MLSVAVVNGEYRGILELRPVMLPTPRPFILMTYRPSLSKFNLNQSTS